MTIRALPVVKNSPDHEFTIELDQEVFLFRFIWNSRTGRWSMNISLEDGTLLVAGVAVVGDFDLLERFVDERLPKGRLFTADNTGQEREPTDENFGDDVELLYQSIDDEDFF